MFRQQLPVHSPIPFGALTRALAGSLGGEDPIERLGALLLERFGADAVVLTASGTHALQVAICHAAGGAAGVVALPAFSCYDVVTAAVGAGVRARFYDIDPQTLGPDFDSLERVLSSGARVVLAASLYGVPLEWGRLLAVAERWGATVIEDAAQGHGARWLDRPLGSLGSLSVLSFGRGKGWTGGGGGALLVRGATVSAMQSAAAGGGGSAGAMVRGLAQWALGRPALYGLPQALPFLGLGETRYHEPRSPRGMSPGTARLVLGSADAADAAVALRRRRARFYLDGLHGHGGLAVYGAPTRGEAGWLRFPVLRAGGVAGLEGARRLGIAPSYPKPLPQLPASRAIAEASPSSFPGARQLARDLLTLPTHGLVGDREARQIIELLAGPAR